MNMYTYIGAVTILNRGDSDESSEPRDLQNSKSVEFFLCHEQDNDLHRCECQDIARRNLGQTLKRLLLFAITSLSHHCWGRKVPFAGTSCLPHRREVFLPFAFSFVSPVSLLIPRPRPTYAYPIRNASK